MKLSHVLILAITQFSLLLMIVDMTNRIEELRADNVLLSRSAADYERCRGLVVAKFGSPVK